MKDRTIFATLCLFLVTLICSLVTQPGVAHHGFDGEYDASRPLYLAGIVREIRWQAPHSVVALELPKMLTIPNSLQQSPSIDRLGKQTSKTLAVPQNLLGTTQRLEFPPVGSMVNPLRERLQIGNRMTAIVYRNCEPPNQLRVQFVQLADGTTVVRPGRVQTEVNGCSQAR
jgi:Family of unknown function (DUF6152)